MTERLYQVFVSSTYLDLQKEREEVIRALLEIDCFPAGMEMFPAADESQWDLITAIIDRCDYYIVIVGGRYGSMTEEGLSFTEKEYRYAVEKGIPVLGFVHGDPTSLPLKNSDTDPLLIGRLKDFRDLVKCKPCKFWHNADELAGAVSRGLSQQIKKTPRQGWVRADQATTAEDANRLRDKIDGLTTKLAEMQTTPPTGVDGLSQGTEETVVRYTYRYKTGYGGDTEDGEGAIIATWDEVFGEIAPKMYVDLADQTLRNILDDWVARRGTREVETSQGEYDRYYFRILTADFETIKIQFLGLGLIRQMDYMQDGKLVWGLTPYGHQMMMKVKAVTTEEAAKAVAAEKARRKENAAASTNSPN